MKRLKVVLLSFLILTFCQSLCAQPWRIYKDSADRFKGLNNIDKAIECYLLSKKLLPADSLSTDTYIDVTTNVANLLYNNKSKYSQAEYYYLEARAALDKKYGKENNSFATNANFLGQINYFLKQYNRSEKFYLEAKAIWERLFTKKSLQYAGTCNALGVLYNDNREFDKAEAQHLEAMSTREQLFTKEHGAYAQSCNNLAALYWNLGQYEKAEPLALEAKEIRGRVKGIPLTAYAISCTNLANIYRDMGKYEQAEELYIEAKKVRERFFTKEHDDYALSCDILADLYYFMKQYDKAEPLFLEAKDIRARISFKKSYFYAQSCSNLSMLYREMGKYVEAGGLAKEADSIWQDMGSLASADRAVNNNSIGLLYYEMKQYDTAEVYFLKAREAWKKSLGEAHPFYTANSLSLARLYWNINKVGKAQDLFVQAFEAQHKQVGRIFAFTSEEEKLLYLRNIAGGEDELQSFYFKKLYHANMGQPYLISLLKRNQVLHSSQQFRQQILNSNNKVLSQKFNTWSGLKKQIAALHSKGDRAPKEHLQHLIQKADLLEKDLVRSSAVFKKTQQNTISWKAIQESLQSSEAAIEFIEFNYFNGQKFTDSVFYVALVLRKGMDEPEAVTLFEKKQLVSLLTKSSAADQNIKAFYTRGIHEEGNGIISGMAYNTIWKPLESKLAGVKKIFFAPAGLLHRIAFSALADDSSKVLSDKYELVQLSSTAAIIEQKPGFIKTTDKIILFGGIQYSPGTSKVEMPVFETGSLAKRSGFNYLPGTAKEVNQIAKSGRRMKFKPVVIEGNKATEEALKIMDGKKSPKILHIASHGFFFDDPGIGEGEKSNELSDGKVFRQAANPLIRSGLLFAGGNVAWKGKYVEGLADDGILTAYEVSNLYLSNTRLVVLSACETALGDIRGSEGVYGLQRAFKIAGVENLVMSLWKVPDAETAEFMELFYENMFNGKAIDVAFYQAQTQMKIKYRDNPYKWAAWILVK